MVGAIPASVQGHELASYLTMLPVQPLGCQSGDVGLRLIDRLPSIHFAHREYAMRTAQAFSLITGTPL